MNLNHLLLFLGLLPLAATHLAAAEPSGPLTVAVFDFESKDEGVRDLGPKLASLITAELSNLPDVITVERAELEKVLGEQELGLSGTISADSRAKVGNLTGAKVLITGRVFKADKEVIATAKIIGTETGRVYGEMAKAASGAALMELSGEFSRKIAAALRQKSETLVAKNQTRGDRLAVIRSKLKDKALPTVAVIIQEQHYGQPAIDPAAQTELSLLLKECGFKLVDHGSAKPDIEITGEAFSAFGLRKSNLVSCKGRVEVKARKLNGEVIAVDRQAAVAVDIAEQTAAKTALQEAAAELAERLLPKLAN